MSQAPRFRSLDVLRGLSILGMALASMIPDSLPDWMYHAQEPPPNHDYRPDIFGITWVDLVFPFFLFTMGAAIPIAVTNRRNKGDSTWKIVKWLAGRGLLLYLFSIFSQHLRPPEWGVTSISLWIFSIFAFGLLILMFGRWPQAIPEKATRALTGGAWILAILLVCFHLYPDGNRGFENSRNDIILMVLANVAFSGAIVWMATSCRPLIRLGIVAVIAFLFLGKDSQGSLAQQIWSFTPVAYLHLDGWPYSRFFPIFYHFEYHKYLMIVLPGTLCGDQILTAQNRDEGKPSWSPLVVAALTLGSVTLVGLTVAGLFAGEILLTSWAAIVGAAALVYLSRHFESRIEGLVAACIRFGSGFLIVGLVALPIGGGIRKDETTLSYFFVTAGLAFLFLAALELIVDYYKEDKVSKFLWLTGMNPILAYAAITNLMPGLMGLTRYSQIVNAGMLVGLPWFLALFDGGCKTMLVGLVAAAFTRKKIFLRT